MRKVKHGFTILEVLIAVAVIGVLVTIGIVNIPNDRFAVRQAAEGLVGDVQLARFHAISRNTYTRLEVDPVGNTYVIEERDSATAIKTVDLADDGRAPAVQIQSADPDVNDVVFDPRGVGIGLGPQDVVFTSTKTGFSLTVSISQQGWGAREETSAL